MYPVDTTLSVDEFDTWAIDHDLIDDPETNDKHSPQWAQLLKQRNALRNSLNKLALHSEAPDYCRVSIDVFAHGCTYKVVKIQDKAVDIMSSLPELMNKRFIRKHRQIVALIGSTTYEELTPYQQIEMRMLLEEGDKLKEILHFILKQYSDRVSAVDINVLIHKERSDSDIISKKIDKSLPSYKALFRLNKTDHNPEVI